MARKTLSDLAPVTHARMAGLLSKEPQNGSQMLTRDNWAAVGIDTSMSSIAVVAYGQDGRARKVGWAEKRWTVNDDYLKRLKDAAMAHNLIQEAIKRFWILDPSNLYIAIEEPVPLGMLKKMNSGWVKQQCEISGAVIGSLMRWGYTQIWQINQSQWKKTIRDDGTEIRKMPEGKFDVKKWAIQAYNLPEWPDLVIGKDGVKIPRPESGRGANAKAVQPDDRYDAAGICAWMADEIESNEGE
jgi:hypothetical protein